MANNPQFYTKTKVDELLAAKVDTLKVGDSVSVSTVENGAMDVSKLFSSENTSLTDTVATTAPSMQATDNYGVYEFKPGFTGEYLDKVDTISCQSGDTTIDVTTTTGTANVTPFFSTENKSLNASRIRYEADSETTVKEKVGDLETTVGDLETTVGGTVSGTTATLAMGRITTVDWSAYTSEKTYLTVNFGTATAGFRYCELLITGVADGMCGLTMPSGYTFKAALTDALTPAAGDNLICFAEYATNCFIVSRKVLSTVTAE